MSWFWYIIISQSGIVLYDTWKAGWLSPWISATLGIISGIAIGLITEYYTSRTHREDSR